MTSDNGGVTDIERVHVGNVGVDTAHLILTDPGYLDDSRSGVSGEHLGRKFDELLDSELRELDAWVVARDAADKLGVAHPDLPDHLAAKILFNKGHEGAAVVVHAGVGDGYYPVWATFATVGQFGRRCVRIEVDFLDHPFIESVALATPDAARRVIRQFIEAVDALHEGWEGNLTEPMRVLGLAAAKGEDVLKAYDDLWTATTGEG